MSLLRFSPFVSPFERVFDRSVTNALREMDHFQRDLMNPYWNENRNTLNFGMDQITRTDDGSLSVSVDVSSFSPEELTVAVNEGTLTIKGNHYEEDGDRGTVVSRQFMRSYRVPDDVDIEQVKSSLSDKGTLTILAPSKNRAVQGAARSIPIEFKKSEA